MSMVNVFILYDSKYGNTKLVAEKIADGLKSEATMVNAGYVREVGLDEVVCSDLIVLGAPNHMGRPSRTMKRFIDYLATADLKATKVAVFGTYAGRARPIDRAVKKLESMVKARLPNLKLVLPGLSVRVNGIKGPVVDGELDRCVEFGSSIAAQLGV
jgi:flavorubredoxin